LSNSIRRTSFICVPLKYHVIFKITIGSKFNNDRLKLNDDFKNI
jgi:hypothetical protein